MKWVKKILLVLVIVFAVYYLISRPNDAAHAVRGLFTWLSGAVTAIFSFFTSLAG
jgi:hypothetical protein